VSAMQAKHKTMLGLAATAWGLAMSLVASAALADTDANAQIRPSRISLGQSAELRVPAKSGRAPALPQVDGLHFQQMGQRSEMRDINGVVSKQDWILYRVVADRPGKFDIPIGPRPLAFEVTPAGASTASAASQAARPSPASASPAQRGSSEGPLAFLRVRLPNKKMFIGQAVPVTFKAYFRAGTEVTLAGAPSLGASAFTVGNLDDSPHQSVETIDGVPYRVATWTGQISAAMSGKFTTHATLPIIARYRVAPRQPAADPFTSMFDDDEDVFSSSPSAMLRSFMKHSSFGGDLDDMFGQVREREMTLRARAQGIQVQPLPRTGQPSNFGGAVGRFDVRTRLAPSTGIAFSPMTLTIEVSGQGNLDRVAVAGLPASADWKTYPPSAKQSAPGNKSFEQAVVPQRGGHLELPAISLSYFDPEQKRYITRSSTPIDVEVAAAPTGSPVPTFAATSPRPVSKPAAGLRPNRVDEGRFVATLLPPYRRAWFWPVVTAPWLVLAAGVTRSRVRHHSARSHRRATKETIDRYRQAMKGAVAAEDTQRFYEAAAAGLCIRLGQIWHMHPDDVTAAEAAARLGPGDASIVAVLSAAEQLRYGAAVAEPASLAGLKASIDQRLEQLEVRS